MRRPGPPGVWAPKKPSDHKGWTDALGMVVACDVSLARSVIERSRGVVGRDGGDGGWPRRRLYGAGAVARCRDPSPPLVRPCPARRRRLRVSVDGSPLQVRGTHLPTSEYGAHLTPAACAAPAPVRVACGVHRRHEHVGLDIDRMVPPGGGGFVRGKTWPAHHPSTRSTTSGTPSVRGRVGRRGPRPGLRPPPIRARLRWT